MIQAQISLDDPCIPQPLRANNVSIMDQACSLSFNTHQLKCINAVRLYYRVTFISEISNTEGTHIIPQAYNQTVLPEYQPKPLSLHQPKPNKKSFSLWTKLLYTLPDSTGKPPQPLGPWTPNHSQRGYWLGYYDTKTTE